MNTQSASQERDTRTLIEECRAALAEELSAWDIDPPLHHVQQAHDKCVAWLAATPTLPVAAVPAPSEAVAHEQTAYYWLVEEFDHTDKSTGRYMLDQGELTTTTDVNAARRFKSSKVAHFRADDMRAKHGTAWHSMYHGFIGDDLAATPPPAAPAPGEGVAHGELVDRIQRALLDSAAYPDEDIDSLVERILLALANPPAAPSAPAVPQPLTDEQIDAALQDLDSVCRDCCVYEYGLPLHDEWNEKLRDVFRAALAAPTTNGTAPQA